MPKKFELMEQRSAILKKAREAVDDTEAFKAAMAEADMLEQRINNMTRLEEAERSEQGTVIHGDPKLEKEIRSRYSIAKAICHAAGIREVDAGYEIEVADEIRNSTGQKFRGFAVPILALERRVITASGAGADLIGTTLRDDLYTSALTEQTLVKRLGARTLPNLVGDQSIPMELTSPNVAWIADNAGLTASDATFSHLSMSPHTVGSLSEISRLTVLQATPAVDDIIKGMMQRDIALEIDRVALNGGGSNQPTGVLANSDITHITSPDSIFDAVIDAATAARKANVGALSVVTTPDVESIAAKARDEQNRPFGVQTVFAGYNPNITNLLPTNLGSSSPPVNDGFIVGDFSKMLIGVWGPALDVLPNPYASGSYEKGNLLIRALASLEIGILNPAAFVAITGGFSLTTPAMPAAS